MKMNEISYVSVHPVTFLAKLNIEMNMAEMLGKVVKRSNERNTSLPTPEIWRPYLGMGAFDREWLGSAKNIVMPPGDGGEGQAGRGGQMHDLNLDILNDTNEAKKNNANQARANNADQVREEPGESSSGDPRGGQSQRAENNGGSRAVSVHGEDGKDSQRLGVAR